MDIAKIKMKMNELLMSKVGPVLLKLMWADSKTREKIQKWGVNVLPINFYSNTPSIDEIKNSFEYEGTNPPYLDESIFNNSILEQTLDELIKFSVEFNPDIDGDEKTCEQFFWNNSQFSYCDAMSYYCFIRKVKPKNIVEIGSGFSTLIAIEAVKKNRSGSVICVEPFPRPFLKNNNQVNLCEKKAQEISSDYLNSMLEDNDILFIDSTHTVKTGSDCLHIYLRLLPKIKRNIYVHVHDIFLPYGMPIDWLLERQIFWTEQYLLMAFLIDNPKATILYGSAHNTKMNEHKMRDLMCNTFGIGGGSLWFKYNGSQLCRMPEKATAAGR